MPRKGTTKNQIKKKKKNNNPEFSRVKNTVNEIRNPMEELTSRIHTVKEGISNTPACITQLQRFLTHSPSFFYQQLPQPLLLSKISVVLIVTPLQAIYFGGLLLNMN